MGQICVRTLHIEDSRAICNPFLGQFKILPVSPSSSCQSCGFVICHDVGIGFDGDYKLVQLLSCLDHHLHAQLYSRRTDSWRELAGDVLDQEWVITRPIKSLLKNGAFAHWEARGRSREEKIILSFDMKNEVFRKVTISGEVHENILFSRRVEIFAKDECSFLLFVFHNGMLNVYESRCGGSELIWIYVMNVELPIWRSRGVFKNCDCVVLKRFSVENDVVLYDYRARKFMGRYEMPKGSEMVRYEGSLISP